MPQRASEKAPPKITGGQQALTGTYHYPVKSIQGELNAAEVLSAAPSAGPRDREGREREEPEEVIAAVRPPRLNSSCTTCRCAAPLRPNITSRTGLFKIARSARNEDGARAVVRGARAA